MNTDAAPAASPGRRDPWLLCFVVEAVLLAAVLVATGALAGAVSPDTDGYFHAAGSANPWGEQRSPLYGWLAAPFGGSATGTGSVALVQALLHVASTFVLFFGARAGGIGGAGAFALASAALLSQGGLYHLRLLISESPSISLLIAAFGLTIAAARSPAAWRWLIVPIVLFAGAGYLLRPTQLPAIVVIPALYALFACRNRQPRPLLRAGVMIVALALPFLIQSAIRERAVGDFNVASYGGFQMSGLAGFMLTPGLVARLPERTQPLAQAILARREAAEAAGKIARTPLNSAGERSFVSAALGYLDIYARSYDDLTHGEIMRLRGPDESWVAFNRRLTDFSFATIKTAPLQYAAWVAGSAARLIGRAIATNATMLVALALFGLALLPAFAQRGDAGVADIGAVSIVAIGWFLCNGALAVLVTFPATRYIDTAATLLPAIPLTLAIGLFCQLRRP